MQAFSPDNKLVKLTVRNSLSHPVEVISFELGDKHWEARDALVLPKLSKVDYFHPNKSLILPVQSFKDKKILGNYYFSIFDHELKANESLYVHARIFGLNTTPLRIKIKVDDSEFDLTDLPFANRKRSPLNKFSFISKTSENSYKVKKGLWEINEDIYVPPFSTLNITGDTTLAFSHTSTLVARGNVIANGSQRHPVVFTSKKLGRASYSMKQLIRLFLNIVNSSKLLGWEKHLIPKGL